ncbi:hypothetical protein Nepgr_000439 [Nepenthes gracilis]|uniref:Uncharacterized protein n=1 Tax=Nepenthes gracilis TaxID=150966 RepID=A0AAD3P4G3_NEPGR|nr:hypothetical protein Nepgr_000439 [Nepenthes gracilis]
MSIVFGHLPLCSGKLPNIRQRYSHVTTIKVVLKGKSTFVPGLCWALTGGKIPLVVRVRAPVVVKLADKFPLRQFMAKLNCTMAVNNLKPGKKPSVLSTDYSYGLQCPARFQPLHGVSCHDWTENPNLFIGLTYEEGSAVSILFEHSPLCFGKLPNIHQGHNNVTMIKVVLKGKSTFGSGLYRALTGGKIPLVLSVRAPVVIVLADKFPLRQFTAKVNCTMVVNNLKPGKKPSILSTDYSYGFEF